MSYFVALLVLFHINQADSVTFSNKVQISADNPQNSHVEPHLSINPNNSNEFLLASVVLPDSSRHHVDAFRSTDNGRNWVREKLPTTDSLGTIDPWTAFDRRGNSFVSLLTATTFSKEDSFIGFKLFRKSNIQNDWLNTYTHILERGQGGSFDQPKLTIDNTMNSKYTHRLYMSSNRWARPTKLQNSTKAVAFLYSQNAGDSFSDINYVAENNFRKQSLNTLILSDGTLIGGYYNYMTIEPRSLRTKPAWTFKSFDGGKTTSYPNIITIKAVDMPLLAADTTSSEYQDRIYMAGVLSHKNPTLSVLFSDSRGERWSEPKKVKELATARKIAHYPAVDGEGRLGILWTEKMSESKNKECYRVHFSHSWDGGESFATKSVLEEGKYCLDIPGKPRMYAMADEYRPVNPRFSKGGEYLGLVGMPEGGFYAVWVQTVDGILQLRGSHIEFE